MRKPIMRTVFLALFTLLFAHAAVAQSDVRIPFFWDPQHRLEKPDLGPLKVIRFLTEDDYPPFHYALPDGSLAGFNVDLARAICDELKVQCTVQARRWDTLLDAMSDKSGDAVIASMAANQQTRSRLDFTAPYYNTPARFLTLKASQLTDFRPESLKGKTIGVVGKSAHEAYLGTFFKAVKLKPYESFAGLVGGLKLGEMDAAFGDGIAFAQFLGTPAGSDCCAFRSGPFLDAKYFGEGISIGVRKGDANLRKALDYALSKLAERGLYADLYLKHFPIGFY